MSRRAILWVALALFAAPLVLAAPVPVTKTDDTVSLSAAKLLKHRKVQKELKMTAEQRIALVDAQEDIDETYEKEINRLVRMQNVPADSFDLADKQRRKSTEKILTETAEKRINVGQRNRLRQIDWQLLGPAAFTDARIQKGLQLTDDQKKAATALAERQQGLINQFLDQRGDEDEARRSELFTFRADATAKFVNSLKPDQRDAWKAMLGEPVKGFDLNELWLKVIEDDELEPPAGCS